MLLMRSGDTGMNLEALKTLVKVTWKIDESHVAAYWFLVVLLKLEIISLDELVSITSWIKGYR